MPKLETFLFRYFGYSKFRPLQKEIVAELIAGRSVLAILPTGGGKSICYQLPALIFPGTALVISPLIALMKDQVEALQRRGIRAGLINSAQSYQEQTNVLHQFSRGYFKLLYVSPERLQTIKFQRACRRVDLSLIAIDEAHCVSQWGDEFRPEYLAIGQFIALLDKPRPIIALTATASKKTEQVIRHSLQMETAKLFRTSVLRENINLASFNCHSYSQKLWLIGYLLLKFRQQSVVVYCSTRVAVEELFFFFSQFCRFRNLKLGKYHAGLDKEIRAKTQNLFLNKQVLTLFSTNAFGMGIDQPDIRLICHFQPPASLEAYSQEIGRAGRDGQESLAVCLFRNLDWQIHRRMISNSSLQLIEKRELALQEMIRFLHARQCKNSLMQSYFGETNQMGMCAKCDRCRPELTKKLLPSLSNQANSAGCFSDWPKNTQLWHRLLSPQNKKELMAVPGIGLGWINAIA